MQFLTRNNINGKKTVCYLHCSLCRACKSGCNIRINLKSVYNNIDIMLDILVKFNFFRKFIHVAINTNSYIAHLNSLFKYLGMLTLSSSYNRCQHLNSCAFRQCHDTVHNFINALLSDFLTAVRAVRNTDSCIKQSEIIINFSNGTNGRTWVTVIGFLVNTNRRRQAFNLLHIRLLHLSQELPCI